MVLGWKQDEHNKNYVCSDADIISFILVIRLDCDEINLSRAIVSLYINSRLIHLYLKKTDLLILLYPEWKRLIVIVYCV